MPTKSIELPPHVAKAFVRDMRAFFKAKDQKKLRLADVKEMLQMREHA
jgi:hypothetical protein